MTGPVVAVSAHPDAPIAIDRFDNRRTSLDLPAWRSYRIAFRHHPPRPSLVERPDPPHPRSLPSTARLYSSNPLVRLPNCSCIWWTRSLELQSGFCLISFPLFQGPRWQDPLISLLMIGCLPVPGAFIVFFWLNGRLPDP